MPFVLEQADVRVTPEGVPLESCQKDRRITSGIQLGEAVNNQTGRNTQAPTHTHTHEQQLMA